jgi:hypothetical protein
VTIQLKRNDTKDTIHYKITNADGTPVNLTGASIRFLMGSGVTVISNDTASIVSATNGEVEYTLQDKDTLVSGTFKAEFEVTFSDGKVKTYPNNGYIMVNIQPNVDKNKSTYVEDAIALRVSDIELFKTEVNEKVAKAETDAAKVNEIQAQVNQLVVEGDSSVEAAQARVKADGTSFTTLRDRLNDTDSLLAQDTQYRDHIVNVGERENRAVISFIDDDGDLELYTRLYPVFKSKGKPFAAALITSTIGNSSSKITMEQLKEMHSNGLETLSHCHEAPLSIKGYTPEQQDYELKESQNWLKNNGFEYEGFVYPQNDHDLNLRNRTRKYYRYAFRGGGLNDRGYLEHAGIRRLAFGAFTDPNPTVSGITDKSSLEYYKYWVDQAVAKKVWLVFMTHTSAHPIEQDTILGQLIDYIDSLGVEILPPSEAFRASANKLSVGDLEEKHLYITKDGNVKTNISGAYIRISNTGINNTTPIDVFEKGITTVTSYVIADNGGFPTGGGTLHTYRVGDEQAWKGLSYQTWTPHNRADLYKRSWNPDTGAWDIWKQVNFRDITLNQGLNSIAANSHKFFDFDLPGIVPGVSQVFGYPVWGLPIACTFYISITANDKVRVVIHNLSSSTVELSSRDWLFSYRL